MNGAAPVIRIEGLVKHYGKVEAIRGIDLLDCAAGQPARRAPTRARTRS